MGRWRFQISGIPGVIFVFGVVIGEMGVICIHAPVPPGCIFNSHAFLLVDEIMKHLQYLRLMSLQYFHESFTSELGGQHDHQLLRCMPNLLRWVQHIGYGPIHYLFVAAIQSSRIALHNISHELKSDLCKFDLSLHHLFVLDQMHSDGIKLYELDLSQHQIAHVGQVPNFAVGVVEERHQLIHELLHEIREMLQSKGDLKAHLD